jgi:hypothetical protein
MNLDPLFSLLAARPSREDFFNQYRDVDPALDRPDGAARRCHNLRLYLHRFAGARYLLVGEAAGYAGCRFSGIPFTSETQLVGPAGGEGKPECLSWAADGAFARSSQGEALWTERSATMVWEALGERTDCLLWNAFPWHPFDPGKPLSNRPPGRNLADGFEVLDCLLRLFPAAQPYAVGRVAQRALATVLTSSQRGNETSGGITVPYIRHPSRGGKRQFVAGIRALRQQPTSSSPVEG